MAVAAHAANLLLITDLSVLSSHSIGPRANIWESGVAKSCYFGRSAFGPPQNAVPGDPRRADLLPWPGTRPWPRKTPGRGD
jgi:hypothetical protein